MRPLEEMMTSAAIKAIQMARGIRSPKANPERMNDGKFISLRKQKNFMDREHTRALKHDAKWEAAKKNG